MLELKGSYLDEFYFQDGEKEYTLEVSEGGADLRGEGISVFVYKGEMDQFGEGGEKVFREVLDYMIDNDIRHPFLATHTKRIKKN